MTSTQLDPSAPALATPISGGERIQALDVVRGFALIGIFLMNIEFFNRPMLDLGQGLPAGVTGWNWLAGFLIYVLVQGKFWTMFSLLFGMGFAVMLTRAERAERNFLRPYLRRIAALAAFGMLHHIFIWGGDILFSYSVAAVGLLVVLYGRPMPIVASIGALAVTGVLGGMGIVPGAEAAIPVASGLALMGLAAMFLRGEARANVFGRSVLVFALVLFVLGALLALGAAAAWILGGPIQARIGLSVVAAVVLLLAWAADRFHDPVEPRMRRLGVAMYLLPFTIMLLAGLSQVLRGPTPPPTGADAALAQVRAEAAAADAAGRDWPAKDKADAAVKPAGDKSDAIKSDPGKAGTASLSPPVDKPSEAVTWATSQVQRERRLAEQARDSEEERRIETRGSYGQAVAFRAREFAEKAPEEAGFAIVLVGMFLIGAWFVRSGVMEDTRAHLPLFRKLALVGVPVGVGLGLLGAAIATRSTPGMSGDPYQVAMGLMMIGNLPACLGYVGVIVLMLHSASALSRVRVLAPLGRMALTNYLTHSLVGTWFFYGHGLGHYGTGRAAQVGFVFAVIVLQVLFCHWWLARFRYGPMEWLWRAITYWQLPAMRRGDESALAARVPA
jgi:uncharacterized protein